MLRSLHQAEITNIEAMLLKSQLCWVEHVTRMGDHRLSSIALHGEFSNGLWGQRGTKETSYRPPQEDPSIPATLTTTSCRHLLMVVRPSVAASTRSSPPLRTPAGLTSWRNAAGGRSREPQQPYQTRPLTAVAAARFASPALALVSYQHAWSWRWQPSFINLRSWSLAKRRNIYIYIYICKHTHTHTPHFVFCFLISLCICCCFLFLVCIQSRMYHFAIFKFFFKYLHIASESIWYKNY